MTNITPTHARALAETLEHTESIEALRSLADQLEQANLKQITEFGELQEQALLHPESMATDSDVMNIRVIEFLEQIARSTTRSSGMMIQSLGREAAEIARELRAAAAAVPAPGARDEWRELFWAVARALNCLPSTYVDGNAHVYKQAEKYAAIATAAPVASASQVLELDFKQATKLLEMYGGEPTVIGLQIGDGHSGRGVYAHYVDLPGEGAEFLGVADDEAAPVAQLSGPPAWEGDEMPPLPWTARINGGFCEIVDANGCVVVQWLGFDGWAQKRQKSGLAKFIAAACSATAPDNLRFLAEIANSWPDIRDALNAHSQRGRTSGATQRAASGHALPSNLAERSSRRLHSRNTGSGH
jgi:hypothetical protein